MPDEPRKRSRFDQTEPEPKRTSRFDRRSRSPPSRRNDPRRSRSPVAASSRSPQNDPAAAAAAAAAKINAQLQAKKIVQHVDVPPIRASSTPGGAQSSDGAVALDGEIYQQDGDYIKDIEVNDLRNRYTLTKGATQKMIKDETGADVTTRGSYYPDKSMATPTAPPLYLHVTSTTKEGLEKAIGKINELMQQELPNLVDERRFRRREPEQVERDELGRRKWPEERIPIDLEPIPGFNLRAQVVGHGGAYVKHIQNETRCRVQIKGRGSGFTEHGTGAESDEPMYLHVAGPDPNEVQRAKELCEDLLASVKEQYQQFKERGSQRNFNPNYGGGNDYGSGGGGGGGRYGGGHRDSPNTGGNGYGGGYQSPAPGANPASAMSPTGGQAGATAQDYSQYAQYYQNGQDPYAAYGGYQAYMQMYYAYYQQQQQAAGQEAPGTSGTPVMEAPPGISSAPGASAPLPPPPGEAPPPPPPSGPPPPPGVGSYSAVPPPPGMG